MKWVRLCHCWLLLGTLLFSSSFRPETAGANIIDSPDMISVDFRDTDVRDVLRSIADLTGVNIVTSPAVKGNITISLREVTLKDAMEAILTVNDFTYREQGDILIVEAQAIKSTVFLQLRYADANQIREILDPLKSESGSVMVDVRTNKLIVSDFESNITAMKRVLDELDQPTPQVTINAKMVDISISDAIKLGVNLSAAKSDGDPQGTFDTNSETLVLNEGEFGNGSDDVRGRGTTKTYGVRLSDNAGATGAVGDATNQATTFNFGVEDARSDSKTLTEITATGILTSVVSSSVMDMINVQLDALIENGRSLLLAAPTITTLNNETASIIIGEKVGIKEQTQTTTGTTETTRFQDVGTKLEVTPQINVDGFITMTIRPEISSVNIFTTDEIRFNTREARTKVRVRNNQTVIIGGLILSNDNFGTRSVPLISKIPILGLPFRGRTDTGQRRELVVFLTPQLFGDASIQGPLDLEEERKTELEFFQRLEREAEAKEKELLDRFYNTAWNPAPPTEIASNNARASQLFEQGEALYDKGRFAVGAQATKILNLAVDKYQALTDTYPDSEFTPESMYQMGRIQLKYLGNPETALILFESIMEKYPEGSLYRKARKQRKKALKRLKKRDNTVS